MKRCPHCGGLLGEPDPAEEGLLAFVETMVVHVEGEFASAKAISEAYSAFCDERGAPEASAARMGRALTAMGFVRRYRKGRVFYADMALVTDNEQATDKGEAQ